MNCLPEDSQRYQNVPPHPGSLSFSREHRSTAIDLDLKTLEDENQSLKRTIEAMKQELIISQSGTIMFFLVMLRRVCSLVLIRVMNFSFCHITGCLTMVDSLSCSPGPRGDQGDKGSAGVRGPRGPIGLKGKKGPSGPRGERGNFLRIITFALMLNRR